VANKRVYNLTLTRVVTESCLLLRRLAVSGGTHF